MASVSKVSILDYFNIVFEGENGKIESNCKACGTRIQAKRSVTSNFVTHLKRKHQAMYDDFVKRKDMKREGYSSGSLHSFTTNGGNTRYSLPISTGVGGGGGGGGVGGLGTLEGGVGGGVTKFDRHDPRQVLISEAIAKMIVRDLQPVSIVENQGFRELLQLLEPRYTPERQHYIQSQLLPAYAYQAQLATRQALASTHALSLSLDLWRGITGATSGYLGVTCHFLTSDWQMRSALLACLPLTRGSSMNRVLSDFEEVCHSHGVSGRAFRVVADPFLATATAKLCCLPGFLVSSPNGQNEDEDEDVVDSNNSVEEGIKNGHGDGGEEGEWGDSWEQGLSVCRVDCFSRSLEQCVSEGLRSCPQLSSTLAKAACFYNYITSAVPPEKLNQVFDSPGLIMGGPGNTSPAARDWASQLKKIMADRSSRFSVKKKEKKAENKTNDEKDQEKENILKKPEKLAKKPEKAPEQPKTGEEKRNGASGGATGVEANNSEENGDFQPIELPPFEIVTGEQMSPFYFKFQFRNVEYSSGRNKTLLCYRVDTPGGTTEPLKGYMEDEHTTAHAEEAFFQQVLPNASQEYEITWYVSSSPCVSCANKLANILQQRKKVRLCIFCSRLFEWEEPEIVEGLRTLVRAGCKLRMMKPCDFLLVWETYVDKEGQTFTPWEDCQENYDYYMERLTDILK